LFFYPSRDSRERALYSILGGLAGTAMGTGLQLLFFDDKATDYEKKVSWTGYLIGGAWVGYWATYALTFGMIDETRSGSTVPSSSPWSWNPIPGLEPVLSRDEVHMRWRIPGVTYRF
jgi:hypothetical protein